MNSKICLFALLFVVAFSSSGYCYTELDGEVYDGQGGPLTAGTYYTTGNPGFIVPEGQTLTIQAGVIIKIDTGGRHDIEIAGTLNINGTSSHPVYFTSSDDNSVGERIDDSDGDPDWGDWDNLEIEGGAGHIDHAVFRYGGRNEGMLDMEEGGTLTLKNSEFYNSANDAIRIIGPGGAVVLENITIDRTDNDGIQMEGDSVNTTIQNCSITNCKYDAIYLRTPDYLHSTTFTNINAENNGLNSINVRDGSTITMSGDIDVTTLPITLENLYIGDDDPETPPITINVKQGVVFKFTASNKDIEVRDVFNVQGISSNPVYFTSIHDDEIRGDTKGDGTETAPSMGDWDNVDYQETSGGSISHAFFQYGGSGESMLKIQAPIDVSDSEFYDNDYDAVEIQGSAAFDKIVTLENLNIKRSDSDGIYLNGDAVDVVIKDCAMQHCVHEAIYLENPNYLLTTTLSNIAAEFNGLNSINVRDGSTITMSGDIIVTALPITLENLYIGDDDTSTPTINVNVKEGVIFKFTASNKDIEVRDVLNVQGISSNPVYFTSVHDDTIGGDTNSNLQETIPGHGDWDNLDYGEYSDGGIDHAVFRYGGSWKDVLTLNSPISVNRCVFTDNQNDAIRIFASATLNNVHVYRSEDSGIVVGGDENYDVELNDCVSYANDDHGIHLEGNANSTITRCVFSHNGGDGIWVDDDHDLTATNVVIKNNVDDGVEVDSDGTVSITQSSIFNNQDWGVDMDVAKVADFTNNYWGDATGPFDDDTTVSSQNDNLGLLNETSTGDTVTDFVRWSSHRNQPIDEPVRPDISWYSNPANNHQYTVLPYMTWEEAETKAQELGGHLVTINDADENEWIMKNIISHILSGQVWIGLTDKDVEGNFIWISGETANYRNWDEEEPNDNDDGEDFGTIYTSGSGESKWNDEDEENRFNGIVEIEGTPPTQSPQISVSKNSLSFGTVNVDSSQQQTITITNTGEGTLSGSVSVSSPFNIVGNNTYNLVANQSVTITVSYNPTSAGTHSGTITCTGGGGASLAVSGNAEDSTGETITVLNGEVYDGQGGPLYAGTYSFEGWVTVPAGRTLTIHEGAILKGSSNGFISVHGTLNIMGSQTNRVYITSKDDNNVGLRIDDSDGSPNPGDLIGITYHDGSSGSCSYATIQYGGSSNTAAMNIHEPITIDNTQLIKNSLSGMMIEADVTIQNVFISESQHFGMIIGTRRTGGVARITKATIQGCTLTDNGLAAIHADGDSLVSSEFSNITAQGNGIDAIQVGGDITISSDIDVTVLPLYITKYTSFDRSVIGNVLGDELTIGDNDSSTPKIMVNVKPGVHFRIDNQARIYVDDYFNVSGTSANPVIFTSAKGNQSDAGGSILRDTGTPAAGDWGHIAYHNDTSGSISHAIFRYGGSVNGAINTSSDNITLTISDSTFSHIADLAAIIFGGSTGSTAAITNVVCENSAAGLDIEGSGTVEVSDSTFMNNTNFGIFTRGALTGTNLTISGNGGSGVVVYSDETVTVNQSRIVDNGNYGVEMKRPFMADFRNNYWGDPSGPLDLNVAVQNQNDGMAHLSNSTSSGSKVTDFVNWADPLTEPGEEPTPTPQLSVSPSSLNFGDVNLNSSQQKIITVTNSGGGTLSGQAATSSPYSVMSGLSFSLSVNQSAMVVVQFTPASTGSFSGSLQITSNGGNQTISLTGTGVSSGTTDPDSKLGGNSVDVQVDTEVVIPIEVTNFPSTTEFSFDVIYDSSKLTYIDFVTDGTMPSSWEFLDANEVETGKITAVGLGNAISGNGDLFKLTFQTSESLSDGDSTDINIINIIGFNVQAIEPVTLNVTSTGLMGDLDDSGDVNVLDASILFKYILGKETLTATQLALADVDQSGGAPNILDLRIIFDKALGKQTILGKIIRPRFEVQAVSSLNIATVNAEAGDTVDVSITVEGNGGIDTFQLEITYDTSLLEYSDYNRSGTLTDTFMFFDVNEPSPGTLVIAGLAQAAAFDDGELFSLQFTVKAGVSGTADITLAKNVGDLDGATVTNGAVVVGSGQPTEPTFTPTPTPTSIPTPTNTPIPGSGEPSNTVWVTDDASTLSVDLTGETDFDPVDDRKITIVWDAEKGNATDWHIFVRKGFGGTKMLGRTGSGDVNSYDWVANGLNLKTDFLNGPDYNAAYTFRVIRFDGDFGPDDIFDQDGMVGFNLEGGNPVSLSSPELPNLEPGEIVVYDDILGGNNLAPVDGTGMDVDTESTRAIQIAWNFGVDQSTVNEYHVSIKVDGGNWQFLGQTVSNAVNYFWWTPNKEFKTHNNFVDGPQGGHTYQFMVSLLPMSGQLQSMTTGILNYAVE